MLRPDLPLVALITISHVLSKGASGMAKAYVAYRFDGIGWEGFVGPETENPWTSQRVVEDEIIAKCEKRNEEYDPAQQFVLPVRMEVGDLEQIVADWITIMEKRNG